mmetsp:Transcript_43775/g.74740  ORF Transcript_43775/g.74740 Transcript_43775/m.74740 type:complete len:269 (-) Transcript_43775:32-838(-)
MKDSFNNATMLGIASFLEPWHLVNLALTCKDFGSKQGKKACQQIKSNCGDGASSANDTDNVGGWSMMEETARQIVETMSTEEERACIPRRGSESWMSVYNELEMLRYELIFDELDDYTVRYVDGDESHICCNVGSLDHMSGAYSNHCIMRAGKHYAEFQTNGLPSIMAGIDGTSIDGELVTYHFESGFCAWHGSDGIQALEGVEGVRADEASSTRFGLLLDLDNGTLAVYKNDRRLGIIKDGISGEYNWSVSLCRTDVKIKRAPIPTM